MKIMAAFVVAFALLVPLALTDSGTEAADEFDGIIEGDVTSDITVTDYAVIKGDVKIADDVTITVAEGAVLSPYVDASKLGEMSVNISVTGGKDSGFYFEEGSSIGVGENVYYFFSDVAIAIDGKVAFNIDSKINMDMEDLTKSSVEGTASIKVDKNTTITVNEALPIEYKGGMDVTVGFKFADMKVTADVKVNGGQTVIKIEEHTLEMSGDSDFKISTPLSIEVSVNGSSNTSIKFDGQEITTKESVDLKVTVSGINATDGMNVDIKIVGKASGQVNLDSFNIEDMFVLKGAESKTDIEFDEKNVKVTTTNKIDELTVDGKEYYPMKFTMKGLESSTTSTLDYQALIEVINDIINEMAIPTDFDDFDFESLIDFDGIDYESIIGDIDMDAITEFDPEDIDWEKIKEILEKLSKIDCSEKASLSIDSITANSTVVDNKYKAEYKGLELSSNVTVEKGVVTADGIFGLDYLYTEASAMTDEGRLEVIYEVEDAECDINYDKVVSCDLSAGYVYSDYIIEGNGTVVEAEDLEATVEMNENYVITATFAGDVELKAYANNSITQDVKLDNIDAEIETTIIGVIISGSVPDMDDVKINKLSADVTILLAGVTHGLGNVVYDPEKRTISAETLTIYGAPAVKSSYVTSIDGTIENIVITLKETDSFSLNFDGSIEFDRAVITYEDDYYGVKGTMVDVIEADDSGAVKMTKTVTGDFWITDVKDIMLTDMLYNMISGDQVTIDGTGRLIFYGFNLDSGIKGTAYAAGYIYNDTDDIYINIEGLEGAYVKIEDLDVEKMSLADQPGYAIDRTTCEGFYINDDGFIVVEGDMSYAELYVSATPDQHVISIDGKAAEKRVDYGGDFEIPVAQDVIACVDGSGSPVGYVIGSVWYIDEYRYMTDLSLTSVKGSQVPVKDNEIVDSKTDSFVINTGAEGESYTVATPAGLYFSVESQYDGGNYYVYSAETKYNGDRAYDIKVTDEYGFEAKSFVQFPVDSEDYVLYHIVNGMYLEMVVYFDEDSEGNLYLGANLDSYSLYVLTEEVGGGSSSSGGLSNGAIIGIVIVVLIIIIAVAVVAKKKQTA